MNMLNILIVGFVSLSRLLIIFGYANVSLEEYTRDVKVQ